MIQGPLVAISRNPVARSRIEAAARAMGRDCVLLDDYTRMGDVLAPAAVVVDLDVPGWETAATVIRERWPDALAAAFISMPDRERWEAAAAAFDLVANRGAIASRVTDALATWAGRPAGFRIRLFEERDAAGRLGLVHRTETSVGPVAVYRIGSRLCAASDVCPHAGGRLSDGTLEGGVITCPLHGSQFDVCSGERVRGPSDDPIATYPVVSESGIVSLHLEEGP